MSHAPSTAPSSLAQLARITIAIAGVALVAMAGIQAWQVFARYVLDDPPSWTEPLALLCMSTTLMFGAAAGVHSGRHFGFFIAVEHARPSLRRLMQTVARLIAAVVGILFALWGGEMMIDAWDYEIAGAPLPQGLMFLPLCLGGALIAIFSVEQLIRLWQSQSSSAS
ncbi:MAG TPA: TRAP transporter small permease [Steroidobacteraceae bacterium]|nr:TRAP transporter small permease [Steroidobacteraceae bacterium]